jgi:hypothetical protein
MAWQTAQPFLRVVDLAVGRIGAELDGVDEAVDLRRRNRRGPTLGAARGSTALTSGRPPRPSERADCKAAA